VGEESAAAEATRKRLTTVKVRGSFSNARLGDILKEFAQLAEEQTGAPILWTYGPNFPAGVRLNMQIKEQPLITALELVLSAASGVCRMELGYVVLSLPEHKHDGWIRLTTTGERGRERPAAVLSEQEQQAQERLAKARQLLAENKVSSARIYLQLVVTKYPRTAAAKEARALLEKLGP
jgi:carotenoid cleavage dioxygenase-like enzyme